MGRGLSICERLRLLIVGKFQNNIPQCKIAKTLKISSSTVHNIIKRFGESGEIFVRKGQGRKPILDARDLRALRRQCIKNRHDSVSEITAWAQDHFQKSLSVNTVRRAFHKCKLKLYHAKKPYLNTIQKRCRLLWTKAHLKWTEAKCGQTNHNLKLFLETMDAASSGLKMRGIIRLVISAQYKSLHL